MGHCRENRIDVTAMEFPHTGFWLTHVIGAALIFFLGMRFAIRRAPLPMAYRLLRMLKHR